jgi:ABC-2 type transport system ATP-binding protein
MPRKRSSIVGQSVLEIDGLAKLFGEVPALDGVSFRVEAGEILGLVGPNGSGKTTLLETMCGLQACDRGEVRWRGEPLPLGRRKDVMFYVPDGITPWPEQKASSVVRFFARTFARPGEVVQTIVDGLGLAPVLHKRVDALSKGFRRRLLIALGLIAPHPVLIMDEPFDGLDVRQTRDVAALLRSSAGAQRALLLSIHQLTDAERICDRLVLLSGGKVRGEGKLEDLKARAGVSSGSLEDVFLALT